MEAKQAGLQAMSLCFNGSRTASFEAPALSLSKTPAELTMPSPCLGEHNYYFYTQVLGISDQEFIDLLNEGIIK